jgi:ABC-type ATPase involved in cell division
MPKVIGNVSPDVGLQVLMILNDLSQKGTVYLERTQWSVDALKDRIKAIRVLVDSGTLVQKDHYWVQPG